jgi:hypothetical protein
VVHHPHALLIVLDAPQRRQQVLLQHRGGQLAPGRGPARGHGRLELDRVRVGEQVDLALPGHQERGAVLAGGRQRVQGRGQPGGPAGHGPHREAGLGPLHPLGRGQPGQHPVDRPDLRRERVPVDQQRQPVVPRARALAGGPPVGLHLQVRGVAVVPVRDQGLPGREIGGDLRQRGRVGDRPQGVPDAVAGVGAQHGRPGRRDLPGHPGGAARRAVPGHPTLVEQEDRLQVGLGGLHQLPAAAHRARHHILVRQHDPGPGRGQPHRADQPALQHAVLRAGRPGQPLLVHVQGGLVGGDQDALAPPVTQQPGGVVILLAWPSRVLAGQDQPDHVVRVGVPQLLGGVLADDVVRWRGDLCESAHPFRGITDSTERHELEPGWSRRRLFSAGRKDLHI